LARPVSTRSTYPVATRISEAAQLELDRRVACSGRPAVSLVRDLIEDALAHAPLVPGEPSIVRTRSGNYKLELILTKRSAPAVAALLAKGK